jgi:arsenite methyltransferase
VIAAPAQQAKPDYGIDAPDVIRNLVLVGVALIVVAFFFPFIHAGPVVFNMRGTAYTSIWLFATALLMVLYARFGKFAHRDRMLAMRVWRGDERVLDVGTGRGLLMIGAAKKLTGGRAIGIDIWQASDLSGNNEAATRRNLELEGVADRCELRGDDARKLSFADASFDVVLSNLCLHNIPGREGRAAACREIARVLKPGGVALISDFRSTGEYVAAFRTAGLEVSRDFPNWLTTFPALRTVTARRPAARST